MHDHRQIRRTFGHCNAKLANNIRQAWFSLRDAVLDFLLGKIRVGTNFKRHGQGQIAIGGGQ